jgi:hypothetical protein
MTVQCVYKNSARGMRRWAQLDSKSVVMLVFSIIFSIDVITETRCSDISKPSRSSNKAAIVEQFLIRFSFLKETDRLRAEFL